MVLPSEVRWLQLWQVLHHHWHQGIIKYSLSSQAMASPKLAVLVICCKRFTFRPMVCDTMRWHWSVCRSLDHLPPSGILAPLHLPFPPSQHWIHIVFSPFPLTRNVWNTYTCDENGCRRSQLHAVLFMKWADSNFCHLVCSCLLWFISSPFAYVGSS